MVAAGLPVAVARTTALVLGVKSWPGRQHSPSPVKVSDT